MKIVSESEVLKLLENRRQGLIIELKRVEEALLILKGNPHHATILKKKVKIFKSEPKLKIELSEKFSLPKTFDKSQKWDEKVLFAVSQKGSSFKEDVAKEICRLEPGLNEKKILNLVSVKLSALLKNGVITAIKEGRKYKYSIS